MTKKVELDELIEEDRLELPFRKELILDRGLRERLPETVSKQGGVYFFYTEHSSLYVGKTDNLRRRIYEHMTNRGSEQVFRWIETLTVRVAYIVEHEPLKRDIYESYVMEQYKPRYNIDKIDRKRIKV